MNDVLKRLRDQRLNTWEQAKTLAEKAADENRAFDATEQSTWDSLNAELEALDRRMKSIADGEARAKETEEKFAEIEGRTPDPSKDQRNANLDGELRSYLKGEKGRTFQVKPDPGVDFRDLVKGTPSAGGNTVPTSFYGRLVQHMIETSAILQAGPTVLNTESGENIEVPKTTAHSTATLTPEANPITPSEPTFGKVTLGAFKYGALMQVSRELIDDTGVDLQGYLAMQAGRALGNSAGNQFVNGTGTTVPRGVLLDAAAGVTAPVNGFGSQNTANEGFDLLIDLFHSVISPYRRSASCSWLMNDTTAAAVRKIKNSDGDYAWQPSVVIGQPDTILGKPVVVDPFVPDIGDGNESIAFGDFSQFFVRFAGGVRFERSDDFAFDDDLVTFRALIRVDSALVDLTGAIKTLVHSDES